MMIHTEEYIHEQLLDYLAIKKIDDEEFNESAFLEWVGIDGELVLALIKDVFNNDEFVCDHVNDKDFYIKLMQAKTIDDFRDLVLDIQSSIILVFTKSLRQIITFAFAKYKIDRIYESKENWM